MAVLKSKFQKLATKLISDKFADFRVAFRVFKESDSYDPRTGESGDSESYDLQAIPLEIEDALRVFANATNDNIYLVALKAGSSQEFDTSYTTEYDGFLYSIERVVDDPADAAYFFSLVGGSKQKAPKPTTRFAPNFNGISQYATSNAQVLSGEVFTFDLVIYSLSNTGFIFDGNQPRAFCYIDASNTVFFQGVTLKINGVDAVSGFTAHLGEGVFEFTATQDLVVETIASRFTRATFLASVVYNFKVGDGSVYNFPLDDGWQNNPTMRNTGSGADGTFLNMTEAAWQEIPL